MNSNRRAGPAGQPHSQGADACGFHGFSPSPAKAPPQYSAGGGFQLQKCNKIKPDQVHLGFFWLYSRIRSDYNRRSKRGSADTPQERTGFRRDD